MKSFVGVKNPYSWMLSPSLKREALFFQKIVVPAYELCLGVTKEVANRFGNSFNEEEIRWLSDVGILTGSFEDFISLGLTEVITNDEFQQYVNALSFHYGEYSYLTSVGDKEELLLTNKLEAEKKHVQSIFEALTRIFSVQLRLKGLFDVCPILSTNALEWKDKHSSKTDVVYIVLNSLPIPDSSTTWEQIIEFRNDPDSQHKFLDLRNWMNEVARGGISAIEVEQKLEYLVSQYQRHMTLHKMKTNSGTLETIVVTGAEFLEGLARVQFSKAAKALFSLKHRRIALMEGELTSLGSEVAYVVKAREAFPQ